MTVILPFSRFWLDDITALEKIVFSDPWTRRMFEEELNNEYAHYFVAADGKSLVGYIGSQSLSGDGEITNLAVAPEHRRGGVGQALLDAVLSQGLAESWESVYLEARASNAPALALYEKNGFAPVGRRKDYYESPREDAILMEKKL